MSRKWVIELEAGKSTAEVGLIMRTLRVLGLHLEAMTSAEAAKQNEEPVGVDINELIDRMKKP